VRLSLRALLQQNPASTPPPPPPCSLQRAGGFRVKPIGPVGAYVTVRPEHDRWLKALEEICGEKWKSFVGRVPVMPSLAINVALPCVACFPSILRVVVSTFVLPWLPLRDCAALL
jgi:hypothetical protein